MQYTATHCNTLQYTATHCNTNITLHCNIERRAMRAASHCSTLQHTAMYCNSLQPNLLETIERQVRVCCTVLQCVAMCCNTAARRRSRRAAVHCSTLQQTAKHCNIMQHTATHCNALQQTATHCNTLQHTATHCNTLQHTRPRVGIQYCNTLQHTVYSTATHYVYNIATLQHTSILIKRKSRWKRSNNGMAKSMYTTLQHTATHRILHCNTLCI